MTVDENTGAALVAVDGSLLWVVDSKGNWDELLEEGQKPPIFTAREVLMLFPAEKAAFQTLKRVKILIPGSRMLEFLRNDVETQRKSA